MKVRHGCAVQATINVLSGKWKVQAVWRLSFSPLRGTPQSSTRRQRKSSHRAAPWIALLAAQGHLFTGTPPAKPWSRSSKTCAIGAPSSLASSPICPAIPNQQKLC